VYRPAFGIINKTSILLTNNVLLLQLNSLGAERPGSVNVLKIRDAKITSISVSISPQ
jgi:hypothetical protein